MLDKHEIQGLFKKISRSYDFLDHLLSLGTDRFWREIAVCRMPENGPYLDLCAGTLDLSLTLLNGKKTYSHITALDFCPAMLLVGRKKLVSLKKELGNIHIIAGDTEQLPLKDNFYEGVMIGFGFRNLTARMSGLREMLRVLKPGGRLVVLEFSVPVVSVFRQIYYLYFCHILPIVGNLLSRGGSAYNHLRDSVLDFPDQDSLASMIRDAGFAEVRYQNLTYGIAAIHWADKPL